MKSVADVAKSAKQPRGGFVSIRKFDEIAFDDGILLCENENIHSSIIGSVVEYMTRFMLGAESIDAFATSFGGAFSAEKYGYKDASIIAATFGFQIKGLDDESIINASKLVSFDVWTRNPIAALKANVHPTDINPDANTINNIRILVKRGVKFFEKYGPITKYGFNFGPGDYDKEAYLKAIISGKDYGGYTHCVSVGEGDFLTKDTIWEFKTTKTKPTSKHTLQIVMYWIMGQHSDQKCFQSIDKLGIFNTRLNTAYILNVSKIPNEIIETIEDDIICY